MHTNRNIGLPYKQFSKATDIRSFFSKKYSQITYLYTTMVTFS